MRRALGPFLTTGVALAAATVVVANPVAPPSRDMQISTTQLSTSPDLLSPSDKSLLSALAPQFPPAGIGPALAQILAALAADAERISRAVDSGVPLPAPLAAALPEQTVYRTEPVAPPFVASLNAASSALTTSFVSSVAGSSVVQALNGLVADTSYLGGKVFEAAYAVVDVIIRVPQFVITTALDLLAGDIAGALDTVKSAIAAFFGPGLIILDGIRDVLYGRQAPTVPPPTAIKRLFASTTAVTATPPASTDESATETTTPSVRDGKSGSARKRDAAPAAGAAKPTTSSSTAKSGDSTDTPTTSKTPGTGKATAGSARSTAGSARDSKSAAGSSSTN